MTDIARAIPLPAVARRGAPTPVHPPTAAACRLFDRLGGALPIEDVHAFEAMSAVTGTLAAHLRVLDVMSRWLAAQGASQEAATRYIGSTYASLARSLEADPVDLAALPPSTRRPAASTNASPRCSTTPRSSRSSSIPSTASSTASRVGEASAGELLLVHHPAEHRRHPGALVEAERAGVARRVDAEPDAALAALPEAPERVARAAPRPRPACATGAA